MILLLRLWTFMLLSLVSVSRLQAITTSGVIFGSETWSGNVFLTGDVTVAPTGKLTISPGTRIECEARVDDQLGGVNRSRIEITIDHGILIAVGTAASPITFTSSSTAGGIHTAGDWAGLSVTGAKSQSQMSYCIVELGIDGLYVHAGRLRVDNCTFQDNRSTGISFDDKNGQLISVNVFTSCIIQRNRDFGIYANLNDGPSGIALDRCIITDNGYGVYGTSMNVKNTTVSKNKKCGLWILGGLSSEVVECVIKDNAQWGINSEGILLVRGSTISGNDGPGIISISTGPGFNRFISNVIKDKGTSENL